MNLPKLTEPQASAAILLILLFPPIILQSNRGWIIFTLLILGFLARDILNHIYKGKDSM